MIKKIITSSVLLPLLSVGLYATPALAWHWNDDDLTVSVKNDNNATVKNYVDTTASTGGNNATGGSGGAAGDGGDVKWSDDNNTGGNGGNGGNGGDATIFTGNATAGTLVANDVNYNKTKITSSCDCEEQDGDVEIKVKNKNQAYVKNDVETKAKTGYNTATGGDSGCECGNGGGDGGDVKGSDDDNDAGDGGDAGNGGDAYIDTGNALSGTEVVNLVNHNVTRIRR